MKTCWSRSPWAQMGVTGGQVELELDVHGLQLVFDEGDDLLEAVLQVDAVEGQVGGIAGEVEEVLDDPRDAFGLGFDLLQDLGEMRRR